MKISDSFHLMAKPTGSICNLDCTYCFYLEKENLYENNQDWRMPQDVLESYIRQYIEVQKNPTITFSWQGGEPTLLGLDFYKKAVQLQKKYSNGKIIENTFQTNGVLLNDEWCEFFKSNNFLIGLSIDGPEEMHNKYRLYKGGQLSFQKVMKGLKFLQKNQIEFNTLTCVQKNNSLYPLEVYNFLKEIGSTYMQFIPIAERKAEAETNLLKLVSPGYKEEAKVTEWSVEPVQFGRFLTSIFDEWVRNDVGKYFIQIFDVALEIWFTGQSSLCIFKDRCGQAMAIEHNGDIYSCDHFVYPENKLGNLMTETLNKIVDSDQQLKFGNDKNDTLPKYCRECEVRFACNGECPKHRFI